MILALLFACGVDGGLDQPNPPPDPPPQLVNADPGLVTQSGMVSEVHGPTRSFVLTGEGKRVIVHLRDTGTLRIGGQPVQISDLQPGTNLWVEGKRQGDLLVIERAGDTPEVASAAPGPLTGADLTGPAPDAPAGTAGAPADGAAPTGPSGATDAAPSDPGATPSDPGAAPPPAAPPAP